MMATKLVVCVSLYRLSLLGHIEVLRRCGLLLQSSVVCLLVGLPVMIMSPAKTAEPIDGVQIPHVKGGKKRFIVRYSDSLP